MQGKAPGERQEITPLGQELDQFRIRAEQLMCAVQIKSVAKTQVGAYRVVVTVVGKPQARQQESCGGILGAYSVVFVLGLYISGTQFAGAETPVTAQLQGQYPAGIDGGFLLLQIQLQRVGASDILRAGKDIAGHQALESLGDIEI